LRRYPPLGLLTSEWEWEWAEVEATAVAVVLVVVAAAGFFVVIDLDEEGAVVERVVSPNRGEHSGGRGHAHNNVLSFNPDVVVVSGMGPRGLASFQSRNIAVLRANSQSVDDIVRAYNENLLEELTEGCAQAHHK
jgi:predicted Fe-Mo cluster-binding NifX family protein